MADSLAIFNQYWKGVDVTCLERRQRILDEDPDASLVEIKKKAYKQLQSEGLLPEGQVPCFEMESTRPKCPPQQRQNLGDLSARTLPMSGHLPMPLGIRHSGNRAVRRLSRSRSPNRHNDEHSDHYRRRKSRSPDYDRSGSARDKEILELREQVRDLKSEVQTLHNTHKDKSAEHAADLDKRNLQEIARQRDRLTAQHLEAIENCKKDSNATYEHQLEAYKIQANTKLQQNLSEYKQQFLDDQSRENRRFEEGLRIKFEANFDNKIGETRRNTQDKYEARVQELERQSDKRAVLFENYKAEWKRDHEAKTEELDQKINKHTKDVARYDQEIVQRNRELLADYDKKVSQLNLETARYRRELKAEYDQSITECKSENAQHLTARRIELKADWGIKTDELNEKIAKHEKDVTRHKEEDAQYREKLKAEHDQNLFAYKEQLDRDYSRQMAFIKEQGEASVTRHHTDLDAKYNQKVQALQNAFEAEKAKLQAKSDKPITAASNNPDATRHTIQQPTPIDHSLAKRIDGIERDRKLEKKLAKHEKERDQKDEARRRTDEQRALQSQVTAIQKVQANQQLLARREESLSNSSTQKVHSYQNLADSEAATVRGRIDDVTQSLQTQQQALIRLQQDNMELSEDNLNLTENFDLAMVHAGADVSSFSGSIMNMELLNPVANHSMIMVDKKWRQINAYVEEQIERESRGCAVRSTCEQVVALMNESIRISPSAVQQSLVPCQRTVMQAAEQFHRTYASAMKTHDEKIRTVLLQANQWLANHHQNHSLIEVIQRIHRFQQHMVRVDRVDLFVLQRLAKKFLVEVGQFVAVKFHHGMAPEEIDVWQKFANLTNTAGLGVQAEVTRDNAIISALVPLQLHDGDAEEIDENLSSMIEEIE